MEKSNLEAVNNSEVVEVISVEPKKYTLRKLGAPDLFPMIKIISKIGLDELTQVLDKDFMKGIMEQVQAKPSVDENSMDESSTEESGTEASTDNSRDNVFIVGIGIAMKLATKILEHIPSCENDIYTLLGNVSGLGVDGVKALDLEIFLEMLIDFIMKDEFKSFFKVASKYIKQ